MRIGLDIDGCMYQWDRTARYMLRNVLPDSPYKTVLQQESQSWDWIKEQVAPEHWEWLWTEGIRLGLFRHGHLYPGAIEAIREMATFATVVAITHRPEKATEDTLAWLAYQRLPLSGLYMLSNEERKSKVRPSCDLYLDDKPANIMDLRANTYAVVAYMRRPWNADHHILDGPEVSTWAEVLELAKGMRRAYQS